MQAAQRSALGVYKHVANGLLGTAASATDTSLTLVTETIVGTFVGTGSVTIFDGDNTETVTASAFSSPTLTVSALANDHPAGVLVSITAASAAPSDFIPVNTFTPADNLTQLLDQNYRGSMVDTYDLVLGPISGTYDTGGDFIADPFGYILGAFFGDVATTGSSAPYSHVFAALNTGSGQPTPYMVTDIEPVQARAYPRMQCSDLSIIYDAQKQVSWTAKFAGNMSAPVSQPTKSYTTDRIIPGWTVATTIGGTYTPTLQSAQVDFTRKVTVVNTMDGSQNPYRTWVGPVACTGKATFVYEDETQLKNYLNNTQPSLVLDFTTGSSSSLRELKIQMSRCAYSAATKTRTGDLIDLDVSFVAVANTTDAGASGGYSPAKVTLQSSKASGTY